MRSIVSHSFAKLVLGTMSIVCVIGATSTKSFAATLVDTELFLTVDTSGSVSSSEFDLQKTGYANAFRNASVQSQIAGLPNGLAVAYGYFSSPLNQNVAVNWALLRTAADANAFADAIAATTRPFSGSTAVGSAINFAANQLLTNDFTGRKVIDVSGDGGTNSGANTAAARDAAFASGITINGLPIGGSGVQNFFQNNVVTPNGFLVSANSFADFDAAVTKKIGREITSTPTPIPTPALIPAMIGFGISAVRKRKTMQQNQG